MVSFLVVVATNLDMRQLQASYVRLFFASVITIALFIEEGV